MNPKHSVFVVSFLLQFIAPHAASPALAMLVLGGILTVMTLTVFSLSGLLATQLRRLVITTPRINDALRWLFATLFLNPASSWRWPDKIWPDFTGHRS